MPSQFFRRTLGLILLLILAFPAPAQDKDTLVIGITQFPASFHPQYRIHAGQVLRLELSHATYYSL